LIGTDCGKIPALPNTMEIHAMHRLSLVLAGVLLFGGVQTVEAQVVRVGYIDSQVILSEAPGAMEAQQEFDREMERFRGEIQRMGEDLERLIGNYQQQERTLSPEAREARQNEIRLKEMEYQQRVDEMEMEAAQRRQVLVEPILERMSQAIETIRSEGEYAVIFDTASRAIVAADPQLDLTGEVIRRLQQMAGREN
jgi:outer membrane protein